MMPTEDAFLQRYCLESLEILETAIHLYQQGRRTFYRVAAIQLRLLLCDSTRRHGRSVDISLLPRLLPGLTLPALSQEGLLLEHAPFLPLASWLDQELAEGDKSLSIRLLIRRVCEQDGGAHVDPKPKAGLAGFSRHPEWVIRIAQMLLEQVKPHL